MNQIKSLVMFYNSQREKAAAYAGELEKLLIGKVILKKICVFAEHEKLQPADAALAVGGDGTVLHAARNAVSAGIPVLGINAGSLGFLSGITREDFISALPDFLSGKFVQTERMLLCASVRRKGNTVFGPFPALNDCIIRCADTRAFGLKAMRGGRLITKYFGDGLIIATPSGSTAYSLASSGPIAVPEQDLFILTPICPHALTQRPVILSTDKMLSVELLGTKSGSHRYSVSLDGQVVFPLRNGDIVEISEHTQKLKLIVPESYDYFTALRAKLRWGER